MLRHYARAVIKSEADIIPRGKAVIPFMNAFLTLINISFAVTL